MMIWAFFQSSSRFLGVTEPVKRTIFSGGIWRFFWSVSTCCSQRGFVGANRRIFSVGNCCSRCAVIIKARPVFPIPVGRTTRVLCLAAVANIVCWYRRGVKF